MQSNSILEKGNKSKLLIIQLSLCHFLTIEKYKQRKRAYNIMEQIKRESMNEELIKQSQRMASRAAMPLGDPIKDENNAKKRKEEAEQRKEWEKNQQEKNSSKDKKPFVGNVVGTGGGSKSGRGRSALSNRAANNGKPDVFMPTVDKSLDPKEFADSKKALEDELNGVTKSPSPAPVAPVSNDVLDQAEALSSEIIAKAGAGTAFEGDTLGIGGLDDVLAQIKRRIWVPLAAPPTLLKELGINPVRGLLLYGLPGCGKTLLARSLGKILSPTRPITVVSGPEIMDKFVGSSEANLRQIFDEPPEIYDTFRIGTKDNGKALNQAALHVIILDEFDAMARARGGRGTSGDQGDAGVARDSVVNQMLAKMDGIDPLVVPTLVIGLTNRRTLIEPALLRPGRFEVQIEVPKPRTVAQRVSILNVHMRNMYEAGRLFVRDAPKGTAAARRLESNKDVPSYEELLDTVAVECDGMSGASLAGVARAAASRALERAVCDFSSHFQNGESAAEGYSISDCLVTQDDINSAIDDVLESTRGGDGGEDEDDKPDSDEEDSNATTKES